MSWARLLLLLAPIGLVAGSSSSTTNLVAKVDSTQRFPDPQTALLLGLIPGGGQIYNGAWLKAVLVIAAEAYYVDAFQRAAKSYTEFSILNPDSENPHLDARNGSAWAALLVYILGMLDAYVDAHLSTFPADTGKSSPAPEGSSNEGRL